MRFICIKQHDITECGAACLSMICKGRRNKKACSVAFLFA